MANKFKQGDEVRLTNYIAGYTPKDLWSVIEVNSLGFEVKVQLVSGPKDIVRSFHEYNLVRVYPRTEGRRIAPKDVKVGDTILTTYTTTAGNTFTRQGTVDAMVRLLSGFALSSNGQDLYNDNWVQIADGPTVKLVKAAPEPHAVEKAKIGDYFEVQRDIEFRAPDSNRYTKVREDVWFVEQITCDGKVNQFCRTNDSLTKAVFDQNKCKLVSI